MRIEVVNMADVFPVEDEFGNKFTSRDFSTPENQAYVKSLAETFENGEPDTPPILVSDGGIYRIKDGNCRIEAMKYLGTGYFTAIIDEKDTDQAIIETVLRTDTKKKYSEIERSRFVQQLILFEPDDDLVARAATIPVEQVKTLRKSIDRLGEDAEELTLERLIAIEEFSDDPELVEQFQTLPEKQFQRLYEAETSKREKQKKLNALKRDLEAIGMTEISSDERRENGFINYQFLGQIDDIGQLPQDLPENVRFEPSGYAFGYVSLYGQTEAQTDAEEEQRKAELESLHNLREEINGRHRAWIIAQMQKQAPLTNLKKLCELHVDIYRSLSVVRFFGTEKVPCGYYEIAVMACNYSLGWWTFYNSDFSADKDEAENYIALVDAMQADGRETPDDEMDLYQKAKDALKEMEND